MLKQVLFALSTLVTLGVFTYTVLRIVARFRLTRRTKPLRNWNQRIMRMLKVAFAQNKILRKPVVGLMHALVFWGFCVILIGSVEMVVDGLTGSERSLKFLGVVYDVIMASGDLFALVILVVIAAFLVRRIFMNIRRFSGIEMKHQSHVDANISLTMILLLMASLLGMNMFYLGWVDAAGHESVGLYPVSAVLTSWISGLTIDQLYAGYQVNWWIHILLIFVFANYLPYSKHFHVFMSVPNVLLSDLEPLGKLETMESITKEVKLMLDPSSSFDDSGEAPPRFGVFDASDATWKNYFDSLACTECGRCTSVCPANLTGKRLSPRKIMMDLRARMKEIGNHVRLHGALPEGEKSLLRTYISEEELWACTTCNACAYECPISINHPRLIVDMRRYLVMEESAAPGELNAIFSNIENNGAPWQYSQHDRMNWARDLFITRTQDGK